MVLFGHLWVIERVESSIDKFFPSSSIYGVSCQILFPLFATGVVDTCGKFIAGVLDTDGKLIVAGNVDTSGKFSTVYIKRKNRKDANI